MKSKSKSYYVTKFELCDRDHFLIVKGISILAALIAYICVERFHIQALEPVMEAVYAIFLACSGYGVSESFIRKRGLVHYWENKIIKVWLPSLAVLVIISVISGKLPISWISKWHIGLKGEFLYVVFAGYAAFWLAARFVPNRTIRVLSLFGVAAVLFVFLPQTIPMKTLFFAFPVGVMFSQFGWKRSVRAFNLGLKLVLFGSCVVVAVGTWIVANIFTIPYVTELAWGICYIAIAAVICFGTYFLQVIPVFGVFVPVGMTSYGMYLLCDNIYGFLGGRMDWRSFTVILIVMVAAVALFTWLRELLIAWNRNMRRKKRTHIKGAM